MEKTEIPLGAISGGEHTVLRSHIYGTCQRDLGHAKSLPYSTTDYINSDPLSIALAGVLADKMPYRQSGPFSSYPSHF